MNNQDEAKRYYRNTKYTLSFQIQQVKRELSYDNERKNGKKLSTENRNVLMNALEKLKKERNQLDEEYRKLRLNRVLNQANFTLNELEKKIFQKNLEVFNNYITLENPLSNVKKKKKTNKNNNRFDSL